MARGETVLLSPLELRMLEVLIDRDGDPTDGEGTPLIVVNGGTAGCSGPRRACNPPDQEYPPGSTSRGPC